MILKRARHSRYLLAMVAPAILYFILFHYKPMYGMLIAFKQFSPYLGFARSPWVGFKHFTLFFSNPDAWRLIRNTFLLAWYTLLWGFPAPIVFALLLNEVANRTGKKLVQTVSYMPHFISTVVVASMIMMFCSPTNGAVNTLIAGLGFKKTAFMSRPSWFRTIYVASEVWQNMGWGAILYLAALSHIDPALYEAATIDGATRFKQMLYVTLPCLAPTVITLLLLRLGHIMSVGFEKVYLLQAPVTYQTSDVIQTYVYRQGLKMGNMGYAAAVGLFNSAINVVFLVGSNHLARRASDTSLW